MNRFCPSLKLILTPLLALCACVTSVGAADAKSAPAIDPKAIEVMQKLSDYFVGLTGLSVNASMALTMESSGRKGERLTTYTVAMQRPNQFAMTVKEKIPVMTLVSDGAKVFMFIPSLNQYTSTNAPTKVEGVFNEEMQGVQGGPAYAFMNILAAGKPQEVFLRDVRAGRYAGIEEVDGIKSHHLSFTQEEFDWEIWVQDGAQPWIQKLTLDFSKSMPGGRDGSGGMKMVASLRYTDWVANPNFPETTFRFVPPEGAMAVASFMQRSGGKPHPLVGKAAPAFKLSLLEGGQLDLQSHKGKDIVILDFWATWCGPCQMSLPTLSEVASEYKDKGVVFYAINIQEEPDTVRSFLKKQGFRFSVPLDKEGAVSMQYGVDGIPQTVIVGKNGVIQVIDVGVDPDLKKSLRRKLDDLIAGKNPVAETK